MKNSLTVVVFTALVLSTAVAWQIFRPVAISTPGSALVSGELAKLLPNQFRGGWKGKELPLGSSELLRQRTEGVLQFDDYVYREFSLRGVSFAVYAAYWKPGKMPTRLVSLHTPDRCWIENGWICQASQNRYTLFANGDIPAVEWRVFLPPGAQTKVYTAFWLLVDGQPYDFGRGLNTIANPVQWWTGVLEELGGRTAGHLFVRVTADRPFEAFAQDPVWNELSGALARLGQTKRD